MGRLSHLSNRLAGSPHDYSHCRSSGCSTTGGANARCPEETVGSSDGQTTNIQCQHPCHDRNVCHTFMERTTATERTRCGVWVITSKHLIASSYQNVGVRVGDIVEHGKTAHPTLFACLLTSSRLYCICRAKAAHSSVIQRRRGPLYEIGLLYSWPGLRLFISMVQISSKPSGAFRTTQQSLFVQMSEAWTQGREIKPTNSKLVVASRRAKDSA